MQMKPLSNSMSHISGLPVKLLDNKKYWLYLVDERGEEVILNANHRRRPGHRIASKMRGGMRHTNREIPRREP